ncbi:MAG: hypothetical protein AAB466_07800 [Verrucomicrobiota bacterium]
MNESSASSPNEPAPACAVPAQFGDHLELPDWSGQRPRQTRVPTDEWLAYCRSNLPLIRSKPGYQERRLKSKVSVEFVL